MPNVLRNNVLQARVGYASKKMKLHAPAVRPACWPSTSVVVLMIDNK